MKALENRTIEAKREMDILDALDEIRTKNAMGERVDAAKLLDRMHATEEELMSAEQKLQLKEDEELARSLFHDADGEYVKRINEDATDDLDDNFDDVEEFDFVSHFNTMKQQKAALGIKRKSDQMSSLKEASVPDTFVKPKTANSFVKPKTTNSFIKPKGTESTNGNGLVVLKAKKEPEFKVPLPLGMLGAYGDSDSD
jgi:Saf4/Yju2 protein